MANEIKPLTPATQEFKEVNRENYAYNFDLSQEEVFRLRTENRELVLRSEKLNRKLDKKKNEFENERTNSITLRQFIQELNTKVQLLENAANPTIPPSVNPILNTVLNEEFVEKLVIEKSGLESQLCEKKREIEFLSSELKNKLTHLTEYQNPEYTLNQEIAQLSRDLAVKEQQLVEDKSSYLRLETECKLGNQLFQEAIAELNARIQELILTQGKQQQTIENNNKQYLSHLQEKEDSLNKQANEFGTVTANLGKERDDILKGKEFEISQLEKEFERTETELRHELEQLKTLQTQSSQNEENANLIGVLSSEISNLEQRIEELGKYNKTLTLELTENTENLKLKAELDNANDRIMELTLSNLSNEEQLRGKMHGLADENVELMNKLNILSARIEEENKQIIASKQSSQDTEMKDKRITDLKLQVLEQQTKVEKQIKELNNEIKHLESDKGYLEAILKHERLLPSGQTSQQIHDLKGELETARSELKCERDNSVISKQLISKMNSDILILEQAGSAQRIADLEGQLAETERARTDMELKLEDMAVEIANRDTWIHTLEQDIGILRNKSLVTPLMPSDKIQDVKLPKTAKYQTKQRHPDTSGATPDATLTDLTPQIIPVDNKSGKLESIL